jgi:hypothetical protein
MKRDLVVDTMSPRVRGGAEDFIPGEEKVFIPGEEKVEGKRTNEIWRTFWPGEAEGEPRDRGEHFDGAWTA